MKYSIVIPTYNSTKVLVDLQEQLTEVLNSTGETFEIIFVNDHSPNPRTWETIKDICAQNPKVVGIQLSRNFGQQSATLCGLKHAKGEYVFTMDDDLQHKPSDLLKLMEHEGHDMVVAQFVNKQHSFFKRITSKMKSYFDRIILGKPKGIQLSAFRMLHKNVVQGMLNIKTPSPYIAGLMFYISKDIVSVPLAHGARAEGQSGYNLFSLIKLFGRLIINNSSLMLRFIGNMGLFFAFMSMLALVYILVVRLFFDSLVAGWASILTAVLFFGGMQLFALGIIGEYLIRIIRSTEGNPSFHVKEIVSAE